MEENKFSGYFCKKCKMIPYIQIVIERKNINILSSCKCHKEYQNIDSFIKNRYKTDIVNLNKTENNPLIGERKVQKDKMIDIKSIKSQYYKVKEKLYNNGLDLKNKLIEMYKKKIEKIEEQYEIYIIKNKKIGTILEHLTFLKFF